jgi:hypothetical protein
MTSPSIFTPTRSTPVKCVLSPRKLGPGEGGGATGARQLCGLLKIVDRTCHNLIVIQPRGLWLAILTGGCATFSPLAEQVSVYHGTVDQSPAVDRVPARCRLVAAKPKVTMTELEMVGLNQPYRRQREEAASSGANALVVRTRLLYSRRDLNCPAASPITDCPGSSGAWFDVLFESYACAPEALQELAAQEHPD